MSEFDLIPVVIPSYDPDEKLCRTVEDLAAAGFSDIIIVDDGSREDTKRFFPEERDGITVLRHDVNRGKGAGLKTAFRYILENRPDAVGCVTADGDGQHRVDDIASCARTLAESPDSVILGARDFSLPNVPERSKKGNRITSRVFRLLFGMKLGDTQTGLRVFPRSTLPVMLEVRGERYEFETNMLIEMNRRSIPYREVSIETVYIDENAASHFRPVRDSLRVYGMIVAFAASSVLSMTVDFVLFTLFNFLLASFDVELTLFGRHIALAYAVAVASARVISASVNYTINRKVVFASGDRSSIARYFVLAVCQMFAAMILGMVLVTVIPHKEKLIETLIKAAVDLVLFFFSFRIQNAWVFKKRPDDK